MPRLDHAAFEAPDPDRTASFYERVLGARVVKTEGHPVMAYVGTAGFAFHRPGGPGVARAIPATPVRLVVDGARLLRPHDRPGRGAGVR